MIKTIIIIAAILLCIFIYLKVRLFLRRIHLVIAIEIALMAACVLSCWWLKPQLGQDIKYVALAFAVIILFVEICSGVGGIFASLFFMLYHFLSSTKKKITSAIKTAIYDAHYDRVHAKEREKFHEMLRAARSGDPGAQIYVANIYGWGIGLPHEDLDEAEKWYRKSAEHDYAVGQAALASFLFRKRNKGSWDREVFDLFRKAAAQGIPYAQYMIGEAYFHGNCVKQDTNEAEKWYKLALDQGYKDAKNGLREIKKWRKENYLL